jgi:hypothetical protein
MNIQGGTMLTGASRGEAIDRGRCRGVSHVPALHL